MSIPSRTTSDVIRSALSLPEEERLAVLGAIHHSLADPALDHGECEDSSDAQQAWKEEIARRIAEINSGSIATVSADEAERMIRGDAQPPV